MSYPPGSLRAAGRGHQGRPCPACPILHASRIVDPRPRRPIVAGRANRRRGHDPRADRRSRSPRRRRARAGSTTSAPAWARTKAVSTGSTRASPSPASRTRPPAARASSPSPPGGDAEEGRGGRRRRGRAGGGPDGGAPGPSRGAAREDDRAGRPGPARGSRARARRVRGHRPLSRRARSASSRVDVRLAVEATAATVLAERPDAVIVATGSHPYVPPVPGQRRQARRDRPRRAGSARPRWGRTWLWSTTCTPSRRSPPPSCCSSRASGSR